MTIEVGKFPVLSQLPAMLYSAFMTVIHTGKRTEHCCLGTKDQPSAIREACPDRPLLDHQVGRRRAGIREAERTTKLSGHSVRAGLVFSAEVDELCTYQTRLCQRRDDAQISAPARSFQRQSHQGIRAVESALPSLPYMKPLGQRLERVPVLYDENIDTGNSLR
jgi:hypothetical protein